eukprot:Opistho-2@94586
MASEIVKTWSIDQVTGWLASVGLGDHTAAFKAANITGEKLLDLEMSDLKSHSIGANITARTEILLTIKRLATFGPEPAHRRPTTRLNTHSPSGGNNNNFSSNTSATTDIPRTHSSSDPPPPTQRRWSFFGTSSPAAPSAQALPSLEESAGSGSFPSKDSKDVPTRPKRHSKSPSSPNILKGLASIITPGTKEKPPAPSKPLPSTLSAPQQQQQQQLSEATSPHVSESPSHLSTGMPSPASPSLGKKPSTDRAPSSLNPNNASIRPPLLPRKGSVDTLISSAHSISSAAAGSPHRSGAAQTPTRPVPATPSPSTSSPSSADVASPPRIPTKSTSVMAMAAAHDQTTPALPPKPDASGAPAPPLPPKPVGGERSVESPPLPPKHAPAFAAAMRKAASISTDMSSPPPLPPKTLGGAPMSPTMGERFSFDSAMDAQPRPRPAAPLPGGGGGGGLTSSASMPSLSSLLNQSPADAESNSSSIAAMYARPLKPKRSIERKASIPLADDPNSNSYATVVREKSAGAQEGVSQASSTGGAGNMYDTVKNNNNNSGQQQQQQQQQDQQKQQPPGAMYDSIATRRASVDNILSGPSSPTMYATVIKTGRSFESPHAYARPSLSDEDIDAR